MYWSYVPLEHLLNIDNCDNRLGAPTISIISINFSFSIINVGSPRADLSALRAKQGLSVRSIYRPYVPLEHLLNIDNCDNRLGAPTISIIDINFSFSIIIDIL